MSTALQEKEILLKSTDARPDRIASNNPSDFSVPNGREEEWRYTPLKRLNNLHNDATANTKVVFDISTNQKIKHSIVSKNQIDSTFLATDRASARTSSLWQEALVVEIPKEQEVEEILPELVTEAKYSQDEEGNPITKKSVKMGDMLPTLVKALQELKADFDAYKAAHP